ncbi:MAG: hypothetical protein M3365_05135 [Gemmatimonadota bacterium]|nr:hypothetical protein [Gemmatimonadota bacterium]
MIDGAATLSTTTDKLRAVVEDLERRLDVTIEVRGATPADVEALLPGEHDRLRNAIPLVGVPPTGFLVESRRIRGRRIQSHVDLDARARAIASAVAEKIAKNPSLIENARARIALRLSSASSGERKELEEWDRLLRSPSPARMRQLLVDRGQRATRLRQTMPFLDILTDEESDEALRAIDDTALGSARPKRRSRKATQARTKPSE